ncbi:MAG: hypothetical protein ABW086_11200 [Sedimenticola sp.]
METGNILFKGLYGTLFLTPIVALLFRKYWLKIRPLLMIGCCILSAALIVSYITKASFIGVTPDILFLYATYFIVGVGIVQLTTYNKLLIKIIGIISIVPLILLPIASIGAVFGIMFIGGDLIPVYQQETSNGYVCRVTSYGNATTSNGGYIATEYETYLVIEVPRKELSIDNTRKEHVTPEFTCNQLNEITKS